MTHDDSSNRANEPRPGQDSRVEDWFGQSVQRDAELVDELTEDGADLAAAEQKFDEQATGSDEQDRRHGDSIDPDQGRSAYHDASGDSESPGATIDDAQPAEPNEPA